MRIKKGDNVKILSGNDKDKTGEVIKIIPKENKIVVKGVNVRKKHIKPKKQTDEGGIISVECPIDSSKANVICPKCKKSTKIGYSEENGKRIRICKKCGEKLKK